jgi:hypothetical protein
MTERRTGGVPEFLARGYGVAFPALSGAIPISAKNAS